MIWSNISSIPWPVLALTYNASLQSIPTAFSISSQTLSGSADGKSILFIIGSISNPISAARKAWAKVCASTPWAASTTNNTPSQAIKLLDTSYEKSTWPGVSIRLNIYSSPDFEV